MVMRALLTLCSGPLNSLDFGIREAGISMQLTVVEVGLVSYTVHSLCEVWYCRNRPWIDAV